MRRFGLVGYPLTHSFSQKYFTAKFERENIRDCVYDLFPIRSIHEIDALVRRHPDLAGLNVTIPYKQSVLDYLTSSLIPDGVRACNCIRIGGDSMTGYNTDLTGFEHSLIPLLQAHHEQALVLGNGGAAEAVVFVLKKLGISCDIVSRQLHSGSTLTYQDINRLTMQQHTLIINTTPLGMFPATDNCPPIPYELITPDHYLFDLVYNPAETLFLQKGKQQGAAIKNGYEMLVIQAEESWKLWNQ